MPKILSREDELIENMKFTAIAEYSNLLKSLPAAKARAIINSGISKIRRFDNDPRNKSAFTRKA